MKAIIQDRYGPAEVLYLGDIERPEPADNQVLIKVHAAGVDRGTWHLTEGKPYLMRVGGYGLRKPSVRAPGLDVAGTVLKIGNNVRQFAVGDEVFGTCGGSFAEYALAKVKLLVAQAGSAQLRSRSCHSDVGSHRLERATRRRRRGPGAAGSYYWRIRRCGKFCDSNC